VNNPTTGIPEYWTFPIDQNARFYDSSTGASWPVFPSDVMFSFARTMAYADLPVTGSNPGWIQTQALLPTANDGIHTPFDNTPQNILGSMLVNDSTYCPMAAMQSSNGCVTFVANGGGTEWPFFLELIADTLGAGIQSCGWASYQGAALPGFPGSPAPMGDGPCLLPGGATTTSSSSFQSAVTSIGATGWDNYEEEADHFPSVVPNLQYAAVGSGPYFLSSISPSSSYSLAANPHYAQPNCHGLVGCYPASGTYIPAVTVNWESTDAAGLQAYRIGQADFATIAAGDTPTLLQLRSDGFLGFLEAPSYTISFLSFNLNFNLAGEQLVDPVGGLNVPSDFFSSVSVRNFLTHAWPYATVNATLDTIDGVNWAFNYGGPIPKFMDGYYPSNVTFPSTDPVPNPSIVGSAGWWWAQANNPTSPYYDPELSACSPSSPCKFPLVGVAGAPAQDSAYILYLGEIRTLSGGALQPYTFDDPNFIVDGSNRNLPYWDAGWAPDYADPTDYFDPTVVPGGAYTSPDSVSSELSLPQFNNPACGDSTFSATDWASLIYWANVGPIAADCQGVAYQVASSYATWTNFQPLGAQRVLAYTLVEDIINQLGLYTWYQQANEIQSYAPWINPETVSTNPMIGGGNEQLWFNIRYTIVPSCPIDLGPGVNLKDANLVGCDLAGRDMRGDNLQNALMAGDDAQGTNLQGANLLDAGMWGMDLNSANLQGANLNSANLIGITALGANLQGANLNGADLVESILGSANFRGANLRDANLASATLTGTSSSPTVFNSANLYDASLLDAICGSPDYISATGANVAQIILTGSVGCSATF
jgi:hypothetical protein